MFDFAISQHRKRRPTPLVLVSRALSVVVHIAALIILIENPWLLSTGMNRWLQEFPTITSSSPAPEKQYRLVGMLPTRMLEPSQATLDKYLHHFDQKTPPVRVRWGPDEIASLGVDKPVPAVKPVPGKEEPKPQPPAVADNTAQPPQSPAGVPGGDLPKTGAADAGMPGGRTIPLPPPDTAPKQVPKNTDMAANTPPTSIPNSVTPPPVATPKPEQPQAQAAPKVFENQKQAISTPGSGLFDTRGFPLGDYANAIIERIKGNWSIPSNLKNSRGQTTVIFFIDKNGNCSGLQVVAPSLSPSLDLTALSAVIGSEPFPPLPKGFPGDRIGAKFVFSYNERQ